MTVRTSMLLITGLAAIGVTVWVLLLPPRLGPTAQAHPDATAPADSVLVLYTEQPAPRAHVLWYEGRPTSRDSNRVVRDAFGSLIRFGDGIFPRRLPAPGQTSPPPGRADTTPQIGPDGMAYTLRRTPEGTRLDRLHLATGVVQATAALPTAEPTVLVGPGGHVFLLEAMQLLTGRVPSARATFRTFDLEALDGGRLTSADYRGRVLLVNLWASWCLPCREEMPALDRLRHEFAPERFALVALSDDVLPADARAFIAQFGFNFPVGFGRGRLRRHYRYLGLPTTYLVDARGRVIYQWLGYGGPPHLEEVRGLIRAELAR